MEIHGGVEPLTLTILQTAPRNPLRLRACILVGRWGVEPMLVGEHVYSVPC